MMKHVDNIEERVDRLLQQVLKQTERRDHLLDEVATLVQDHHALQPTLTEIHDVRYQLVPTYVENSAALAHTVESSAALAERSSKKVKRLDALLRRVQRVKSMAESMVAMEHDVAEVPQALERKDLERTVALLKSYEEARQVLSGGKASPARQTSHGSASGEGEESATKEGTSPSPSPAEPKHDLIVRARAQCRQELLHMAEAAMDANDKLTIMKATRLLSELGFTDEGCRVYCDWICKHTIAALKKMVDRELEKMEDPTQAAMSHLALVSQALDTVVATFEAEEDFAYETFGSQGPLLLLSELHTRSTAQCVPVLRDFMQRRSDVLQTVQQHEVKRGDGSSGRASSKPGGPGSGGAQTGGGGGGGGRESSPPSAAAAASAGVIAADARRADQMLEELSHLVSCCHLYLDFAESKQKEYRPGGPRRTSAAAASNAASSAAGGSRLLTGSSVVSEQTTSTTSGADHLWDAQDNALLRTVQELFSIYIPLQNSYFNVAFEQALQLQLTAVNAAASRHGGSGGGAGASASPDGPGSPRAHGRASPGAAGPPASPTSGGVGGLPISSPAALMAGLTNLYTAALSGELAASDPTEEAYSHVTMTLHDDVFFFLRIAVHRAVNTKSAQITSSVVMSALDVIQGKLQYQLEKRATLRRDDVVLPSVLRWASTTHQTVDYTKKLADELRQLAAAHFQGKDAVRFKEQAQDFDQAAKELHAFLQQCLGRYAQVCFNCVMPSHTERFANVSYNITEDVFYHYELNDPWVHACLVDWANTLDYIQGYLDPVSFDQFLLAATTRVLRTTTELLSKKKINAFGALQVDKDVRALRVFFTGRANEISLREVFAPLVLTATLLLSDTPRDALEEVANTALSADEKRAVLLTRVDFKQEEVRALKL